MCKRIINWTLKDRVAQKLHRCEVCSWPIMRGDSYVDARGVGSRRMISIRFHHPCHWLYAMMSDKRGPHDCLAFSDTVQDAKEFISPRKRTRTSEESKVRISLAAVYWEGLRRERADATK